MPYSFVCNWPSPTPPSSPVAWGALPGTVQTRDAPLQAPVKIEEKKPELQMIELPLRFYLLSSFGMTAFGKDMNVRVRCDQLQVVITPEVNRIWKQAGISFVYKGCTEYSDTPTSEQRQAIGVLENANREDDEKDESLNAERKTAIKTLSVDLGIERGDAMSVYIIPYMGSTRQGNAIGGDTSVMVGNWTNKPSNGTLPPQETLMVERGPFRIGSMARTIAHELGHCLDLGHPPNDSTKTSNLMGGPSPPGYKIAPDQIKKSRMRAKEIIKKFKTTSTLNLLI